MAREAVKAIKAEQSRNSALKVKQLEHIVPLENQTDTATILISENISRSRAHSMTDQISKLSLMERPEGDDVGEYQPLVQTSQNSERRRGAIMKNLAMSKSHMKVNHTRNSEEIRMMNQIKTRPSVNRYRSGSSPTLPIRNDQKYALVLPNSSKSPEISARLSLKSFENFQTLQSDKPSDPSFSKDQQQYCDYQLKEVSKRTSFNSKPTEEFSTQTIKIQRNTGSSGKSKPSHSNYGQDQVESSQSLMLKSRLSKISMNSNEDETQTSKKIIDQLENFLMELDDRMGIFDRRMSKNLYRAGIKKVEWIIDLSYDELRKINERLKKSYHEERNQKKSSNETGGRSNGKGYDEKSEDFSERTDGKDSDDDYGEEDYYLSPFQEISLIKKLNEFKEKQKLV
ncbi:hypothetical protein BY996DRAFT_7200774 [Phakopsora pachyrhizi]|nr:hypothetical protein BY996DRAFT_7200774 [Phakopsora pachyrhizi]